MSDNIQAAIDAGKGLGLVQYLAEAGVKGFAPLVIVPSGYSAQVIPLEKIEPFMSVPNRKKGKFVFGTVDSFIRYFLEHKTDSARIFAELSETGATFKGILNFHGSDPSFNDHVCLHTLEATVEWKRWMGKNGVNMTQAEFATFLEENQEMFSEPKGADLLELVRNLEGHSNIAINSVIKDHRTGAIKLNYDEEVVLKGTSTTQAGDMELPSVLTVGISPFRGMPTYAIKARLRFKVESRKVFFRYETIDAHRLVEAVCKSVMDLITEKTGVQPFVS